jgi:hypothetical protein
MNPLQAKEASGIQFSGKIGLKRKQFKNITDI